MGLVLKIHKMKKLHFHGHLDGFNDNILDPDSQYTTFEFPSTELDQIFSFILTVSDSENSIDDTVSVFYLDNDAPVGHGK